MNRLGFNLGKGADELEHDRYVSQIQRALRQPKTIAVVGGKGSSGKTTASIGIGATIAQHKSGEKVVLASIDPIGNVTHRIRSVDGQPPRSMVSLASDPNLHRDSDVSSYLLRDQTGLRVLGSSLADGAQFLTPQDLHRAHEKLREFFNIVILDFGGDFNSLTFHKGLELSDQLVLVAETTADSIDSLHDMINTMRRFGDHYAELIRRSVVVFVQARRAGGSSRNKRGHVDLAAARTRITNEYGAKVVTIPFDGHIAEGGPISLDLLDKQTSEPLIWLTAAVVKNLPGD